MPIDKNENSENPIEILDDPINTGRVNITGESVTTDWVLNQIETAKKQVLEDARKDIDKQVQTDKASLITVFGIFASVISFLTIEFQFLKTLCSFEKILGFTLILFVLLLSFNIGLDYLVKSRLSSEVQKPSIYYILMLLPFFLLGLIYTSKGNEEICNNNSIYQRYSEEFTNKTNMQNEKYNEHLRDVEKDIRNINKRFDDMNSDKDN